MRDHEPDTATAAVPDAVGLPAQRWKATAASNLPQADAAGFLRMMERVAIEIAAVEHERLCAASADRFGHSGVVGLRGKRGDALHARLRAELNASK